MTDTPSGNTEGAIVNFEDWPLHDAVLQDVSVDWEERTCTVRLLVFLDPKKNAVPCLAIWQGVSGVEIPMAAPWGRSIHINAQRRDGTNRFLIEVQSGDTIAIEAASATLRRVPREAE